MQNVKLIPSLLNFFRKSRVTFDTQETRQQFGPIIIDFQQVQ